MAAAIVWFEEDLGVADAWYGMSVAAYGIGCHARPGVGRRAAASACPLATILVISAPVYAASCALGVVALEPWLLPLGWLVWGVAMGPELVLGELLVVESVPEDVRGRAFAAMAVLTMIGMAVGYGVAGPMVEAIGARATIAWTAVVILTLAVLWIGPARRGRPHRRRRPLRRRRPDRAHLPDGHVSTVCDRRPPRVGRATPRRSVS